MFKFTSILIFSFWLIGTIQVFSQESEKVISVEEFSSIVNTNLLRNKGNTFIIKGTVYHVNNNNNLWYKWMVVLHNQNSMFTGFLFPDASLDSISNIEPNDIVTIRGIVEDADTLKESVLIAIEKKNPPFQIKPLYTFEEILDLKENRILLINGKRLRFTGKVKKVDGDSSGYNITVYNDGWDDIFCYFSIQQNKEELLNLNSGDKITIEGTFRLSGSGWGRSFYDSKLIHN